MEKTTKETITCSLTNLKIIRCPVSSCIWWGSGVPGNCIAHDGIPEQGEISERLIMRGKLMSWEEYKTLKNRGIKSIERLIVINTFVDWLATKPAEYFKWREAYSDRKLKRGISKLADSTYPYNVRLIKWNIGRVLASLSPGPWEEFYKAHPKIKREPPLRTLGFSKGFAREVVRKYRMAYRRHLKAQQGRMNQPKIGVKNGD